MNRCSAINKNNKKCRAIIKDKKLFCCESHEPINKEIINGCFLCMEKIENANEIFFFKCKHAFHKPCYKEWLSFSTYEEPICIICRNVVFNKKIKDIAPKINNKLKISDITPILDIFNTLNLHKKCSCGKCFGLNNYINISDMSKNYYIDGNMIENIDAWNTMLTPYNNINIQNDYLSNSGNVYPQNFIPHPPDTSPPNSPKNNIHPKKFIPHTPDTSPPDSPKKL